jgi:hypothetical protein
VPVGAVGLAEDFLAKRAGELHYSVGAVFLLFSLVLGITWRFAVVLGDCKKEETLMRNQLLVKLVRTILSRGTSI